MGPGEVNFTAKAQINITGLSSKSITNAQTKSIPCLAKPCSEAAGVVWNTNKGTP